MAPLQLFCLPYAGASATAYLRWRRLLPAAIGLVPLEPPGRGARLDEPLLRDFEALAGEMADVLCRHLERQAVPYALFGHSMGGLLAWRLCHLLRERGHALPQRLLVSGCAAPTCRDPDRLAALRGDAALSADLRQHGGTPEAVFADAELLRLTLDVLDADYRVCESFRCGEVPPLPLPIHVFAGLDDPIAAADLHAWAIETRAGHTLDWFAGGHFFLHDSQAEVVGRLIACLNAAPAAGAGAPLPSPAASASLLPA
ncbi:thioesterase II family protein [Cupriavidus sp. MP-37]|uniref:thioesterase II family protein n=1 Tax=Cupriavidus sp. MP-37 TaxID=2884455 RepID=UPI001D0B6B82|nr:alpha/beta fold hydrolase [Cupriavidus sp. MP-37]UDM53204.1 alpha/beta fold hydrolase [Cupriavidus sp. MP-37]